MTGRDRPQIGNGSVEMAPHNIFRCAGDDAWVAIAATSDDEWRVLARTIGGAGLMDDSRFATARDRVVQREELERLVSAWTSTRGADDAAETLRQAGVPAARVANSRHLIESDAQLAARGYWQRVEHPELGNSLYASPPYRIDTERVELARPPLLGEHNREILSGLLGLDAAEIDKLEASGVFK
jgi:benzylsuccinate CoA-transferase BbsF subunit